MTLSLEPCRCRWCGAGFAPRPGPGRRPLYCRRSHRQRAYEARRLARAHRLGADDVLVARATWEEMRDCIYMLQAALEDVVGDLRGSPTRREYAEALAHLEEAARRLVGAPLEPRAVGS